MLRLLALGALALFAARTSMADDAVITPTTPDTDAFVKACAADPAVSGNPDLGPGLATKTFCGCLAHLYGEQGLSQSDVDVLTKMRLGTFTDQDRMAYETVEDLMAADDEMNGECVASWQTADH